MAILGIKHENVRAAYEAFRTDQTQAVLDRPDPREG